MSYSDYAASDHDMTHSRPDKALVVKCTYDEAVRKITFNSTRTCSYDLLRQRIEESFSLFATPFAITYTDDDGEVTDIGTDYDLTEAIRYVYPVHDDPPISSSSSILSGRSLTRGKITLRVRITVEYDGPSLSDTSSLVSLEEYRNRSGSEISLSFSAPPSREAEDDSVTVSSKDMGSKYDVFRSRGPKTVLSAPSREPLISQSPPQSVEEYEWEATTSPKVPASASSDILAESPHSQQTHASAKDPFSDDHVSVDPSSVLERLKIEEDIQSKQAGSAYGSSTLHSERGAAWLRDQSARTLKSMLHDLSSPLTYEKDDSASISVPDTTEDAGSVLSGELALQQDSTGKFYYAYTGGSSSSYASSQGPPDSGYEDASDIFRASIAANPALSRPTSMEVSGYEFQDIYGASGSGDLIRSGSNPFSRRSNSEPVFPANYIHPDVPPEVLQYVTAIPIAPPENPPGCSNCGTVLDTFRYVCSTCGEKEAHSSSHKASSALDIGKGKHKASDSELTNGHHPHTPSPPTMSSSPSMSAWSLVTDGGIPLRSFSDTTLNATHKPMKPLPAIPTASNGFSSSQSTLTVSSTYSPYGQENRGYELCWQCLASAGVTHALEMSVAPGSSPSLTEWPSSPEDAQRAMSQWRRSAPSQKGQLRHAYVEKSWGHKGWQDVEQDEQHNCMCSTCGTQILHRRYKCASCENFNLCKACYSQVHEVHPSHAFLIVPDKMPRSRSEPSLSSPMMSSDGERSLKHPGVKCMHCMQDIVGARFHCAICDSVDICSNCESAGLPGNLDSFDGGHNSSHIMIKIPYPLDTAELQSASQRAKSLWTGRDAATGQRMRSRRNSLISSYERTVVGVGSRSGSSASLDDASIVADTDDHGSRCDGCNQYIVGVRYQCGSCSSVPKPFSLCSSCEERSYVLHDPWHVFFKFPRPLDRPLQVDAPLVPRLYMYPAGPLDGTYNPDNPKAYLADVLHTFAVCDRCMTRINGEWFRCGYCSIDLCEVCQRMDTHNDTHAFVVFKSLLEMSLFKQFASDVHNPLPIIPYPIYNH